MGITGMHAIERILWADSIPETVVDFEDKLPGYAPASFPTTEAQAAEFKTGLCGKLIGDAMELESEWQPSRIDLGSAFKGLISLMNEQNEKGGISFMKLTSALCLFLGALGGLVAAGCSSDSSSAGNSSGGTGGSSGIAPQSHDVNESCPDGISDCKAGLQCDSGDPNGQCYMTCDRTVLGEAGASGDAHDAQCGDPTKFAYNSEGHCYPRCTTVADCARASEGYVCKDDDPPRPPVKFCDGPD